MRGKLTPAAVDQYGNGITPADAGKTLPEFLASGFREDHPRGCGENAIYTLTQWRSIGSPPRMRGKHIRRENDACTGRITPADAGKTTGLKPTHRAAQDHPRGCRENGGHVATVRDGVGSPPRMRGKLHLKDCLKIIQRITPADAGKTGCSCPASLQSGDHPRGCGENSQFTSR